MYSPFFIPQHGGKRPAVQPQTIDSEVLYEYLPFLLPSPVSAGQREAKIFDGNADRIPTLFVHYGGKPGNAPNRVDIPGNFDYD